MNKRKAFTLIELLVVIAIIALLMAILMPTLRSAKNQARAVICKSNLNQWGKIFYLYTYDNDSRFMVWKQSGTPGGGTWIIPLMPYYETGGQKARLCPMATKTENEGETIPARMAWDCEIDEKIHKNSYGINNWCYDLRPGVTTIWGLAQADSRAWRRIDPKTPLAFRCFWSAGDGEAARILEVIRRPRTRRSGITRDLDDIV